MDKVASQLHHLRPGDLLRVSCPMTRTRVADVSQFHAFVEWPWGQIDPSSKFRWNGQHAFSHNPNSSEWIGSLFRTDPEPWLLSPGDECRVGVPETFVRLVSRQVWEPPQDRGRLPRPANTLWVVPSDHPEYVDLEDAPDCIHIPCAEPLTIERVATG